MFECVRDDAAKLGGVGIAFHSVRLTGAGLTVCKNCAIIPTTHAFDDRCRARVVDGALLRLRPVPEKERKMKTSHWGRSSFKTWGTIAIFFLFTQIDCFSSTSVWSNVNIFGGSRSSAWDRRKKKEKKGGWGKRQHKRLRKMCAHTRMHTQGPAHGHIQRHLVLPSGFSQTQCRRLHQQSSTDFSRLASLCVTMVELAQQHGRTRLPSRQLWPWRPSLLFFARLKPSCVEKTLVGNSRFLPFSAVIFGEGPRAAIHSGLSFFFF